MSSSRESGAQAAAGWKPRRVIDLAVADPELFEGPAGSTAVRQAPVPPVEELIVRQGEWDWSADARAGIGLLVLDGFLLRRVELAERRSVELLGPGDLLRPFEVDFDLYAMVPSETSWSALSLTRLAVLDARFTRWLADQPLGVDQLLSRVLQRSRTLTLRLALAKLPRLSARLHFLLWHLADRFGRQTTTGILLKLPLSHDVLADLVSAQRPSVSSAMKELERCGLLTPLKGEGWRLNGQPPTVETARLPHPARRVLEDPPAVRRPVDAIDLAHVLRHS